MCQVFYLRVLPTLILFAHLPGNPAGNRQTPPMWSGYKAAGVGGRGEQCREEASQHRGGVALPSRLAFMFNSCANCRGNLASSVLNAVRCF